MITEPDGVEVVATREHVGALDLPPLLIVDALREFLDDNGLGEGDLAWERIGDGQANITYRLYRGQRSYVLRRGPRPPYPRSAHDMVREARIQELVGAAGIAVPNILVVCEDTSVLGVPFYVMDFLDGVVITDDIPAALTSDDQRRATVFSAVDALVDLHRVDVTRGALATVGRPEGYLGRQVSLFASLWDQGTERSLPDVARVGSWLASNLPTSQRAAVVHGDFRLGNLMYANTSPAKVQAILDWEMATVGDPLADLGYFTATYAAKGSVQTPLSLTSVTREPGYPSLDELVDRYAAAMPLDLSHLAWYQALALWKAAIFCEAIYTRWLHGERPGDDFAPTLEHGVPTLVEQASTLLGM